MTASDDYVINYRECSGVVRVAADRVVLVEGTGNLLMSFQSGGGWIKAILPNVVHVPLLG